MAAKFLQIAVTDAARKAQEHYFGRAQPVPPPVERDALGEEERQFIGERDSFYMATVTEGGWPYVQHRGGNPGFLRVIDSHRLAFADYKGNRQMISTGNISSNDKVALFLMDYPRRTRLKILGNMQIKDARDHRDLVSQVAEREVHPIVERLFFIDVVAFDWNCPKYITPRYTAAEVKKAIAPLQKRIRELEGQLSRSG